MKREAIAKWVWWRKWASITETESKPSGNLRRMERERECVGGGGLGVMRSEEYKVEEGFGVLWESPPRGRRVQSELDLFENGF